MPGLPLCTVYSIVSWVCVALARNRSLPRTFSKSNYALVLEKLQSTHTSSEKQSSHKPSLGAGLPRCPSCGLFLRQSTNLLFPFAFFGWRSLETTPSLSCTFLSNLLYVRSIPCDFYLPNGEPPNIFLRGSPRHFSARDGEKESDCQPVTDKQTSTNGRLFFTGLQFRHGCLQSEHSTGTIRYYPRSHIYMAWRSLPIPYISSPLPSI